jgi:L-asparaginase
MQSRREFLRQSAALSLSATIAPVVAQQRTGLPKVVILATGGTIAAAGSSATDLSNYRSGALPAEEILKAVPQVSQHADVRVEQALNIASFDLTVNDWLRLATRINRMFREDEQLGGVVITHGTSVLEETAYFLNLTVKDPRPVVLVGSMRPATAISADGPLNLLNAVRTAVAAESRGKGVLVVMNDEINGAREVTKTNTFRVETFQSPDVGVLGYVHEDQVTFYRASTRRHTAASEFDVEALSTLPKVDILYSYLHPDTDGLHDLVRRGARGVVFAGSGAGSLPESYRSAIRQVRSQSSGAPIRFGIASRVGSGRVIARDEYTALGMIPADNLNPQKARILLMLGLTHTTDHAALTRMFREY